MGTARCDRSASTATIEMTSVVELSELSKTYGDVRAVDRLSLAVEEGEIYGFLGLNGAGKTTSIRMMLGMVKPTTGTARILGQPVRRESKRTWAQVGYLVETPSAYSELTVRDNLQVFRRLHLIPRTQSVDDVIERLGLERYADRRAGSLSLGNAQRLGLAKALLHRPRLLVLDEPVNGLDPAGVVEIRDLLKSLAHDQGVTVFMSSHLLAEVARVATRIGVIDGGRLVDEWRADELANDARRQLIVRTTDDARAVAVLVGAGHSATTVSAGGLVVTDARAVERPDAVATLLVESRCAPFHLAVQEEDMEQRFLRTVGPPGPDRGAASGAKGAA
jgi:ABC-2 type transport system ATP-binding protein